MYFIIIRLFYKIKISKYFYYELFIFLFFNIKKFTISTINNHIINLMIYYIDYIIC
jgi:hypothetical protein